MEQTKFFETAPIPKLFLRIALPGAIGMLFSAIYPVIDGIFLTNYLGETSFGAMNLTFPFIFILFCIADLFGVGSSVIIAIRLGEKKQEEANRVFTSSILTIFVLELLIAVISYFCTPYIVQAIGAEGELLALGTEYMQTYILFMPLTALVFAMDNYLRICGHFKMSMLLNIGMSLGIIFLEWLFLDPFKMGIIASPLANSISFTLCTAIAFIPFFSKSSILHLSKPKISIKELGSAAKNGLSAFLTNIASRVTGIIFNIVLLSWMGQNGVNAYGTLLMIESFILPLMYGTCDSLQPAIGYNYGAKHTNRVKALERLIILSTMVISLLSFSIMISAPSSIASLFTSKNDLEALELTTLAIFIYSFTYLTRFISYAGQSIYSSLGKANISMTISLSIGFFFPMLFLIILDHSTPLAIWLNFPLSSLAVALLTAGILLYRKKKGKATSN